MAPEVAGEALVGAGARDPSIKHDTPILPQGRGHLLGPELCPCRHIEHDFRPRAHRDMLGTEQDFSYLFAYGGTAGVPKADSRHGLFLQPLGQELCLRTLSAAVRAVKHDKLTL